MSNSLSVDKDYTLWVLLLQARDVALKLRQKELRRYGISPEEAGVLFILHTIGNTATPAEISRWLLRKHHTVLGILGRMEKAGLIRKMKDSVRKNLVRVSLTEKGQQAYYQSIRIESIREIMSSLSEEERQQLNSCLQTLRDKALKGLGMDQKPPFP